MPIAYTVSIIASNDFKGLIVRRVVEGEYSTIEVSAEDGIGVLTISREDKLNALDQTVLEEMVSFLSSASGLRGLLLTGAGEKSFIAGADILAMSKMSAKEADHLSKLGQEVTIMLEALKMPVIACVNGFALGGGCEMAMACDFILASKNALFGLPEVKLGLIPGFGGTQRLSRVVGLPRARELVYTGRSVAADEARSIGLVLEVLDTKEAILSRAREIISQITKNSPTAVGISKASINDGACMSMPEALQCERNYFTSVIGTPEMVEGTSAFLEKRKPKF